MVLFSLWATIGGETRGPGRRRNPLRWSASRPAWYSLYELTLLFPASHAYRTTCNRADQRRGKRDIAGRNCALRSALDELDQTVAIFKCADGIPVEDLRPCHLKLLASAVVISSKDNQLIVRTAKGATRV
jgi:hypothetical protein